MRWSEFPWRGTFPHKSQKIFCQWLANVPKLTVMALLWWAIGRRILANTALLLNEVSEKRRETWNEVSNNFAEICPGIRPEVFGAFLTGRKALPRRPRWPDDQVTGRNQVSTTLCFSTLFWSFPPKTPPHLGIENSHKRVPWQGAHSQPEKEQAYHNGQT